MNGSREGCVLRCLSADVQQRSHHIQPALVTSCAGGILHVKFVTALPSRLDEVDESRDGEHGECEGSFMSCPGQLPGVTRGTIPMSSSPCHGDDRHRWCTPGLVATSVLVSSKHSELKS